MKIGLDFNKNGMQKFSVASQQKKKKIQCKVK